MPPQPTTYQYDFLVILTMYVWVPLAIAFLGLCVACLRPRTRSSIVGALLTLSYLAFAPVSIRVFQYFG